jgi:hypothetical protein
VLSSPVRRTRRIYLRRRVLGEFRQSAASCR